MSSRSALAAAMTIGALASPSLAIAEDNPPLVQAAFDCVDANAGRVMAVKREMEPAFSYLIGYVCVEEAGRVRYFVRNTLLADLYNDVRDDSFGPASVDPETGDLKDVNPAALPDTYAYSFQREVESHPDLNTGVWGAAPSVLHQYAGRAMLEAYEGCCADSAGEDEPDEE